MGVDNKTCPHCCTRPCLFVLTLASFCLSTEADFENNGPGIFLCCRKNSAPQHSTPKPPWQSREKNMSLVERIHWERHVSTSQASTVARASSAAQHGRRKYLVIKRGGGGTATERARRCTRQKGKVGRQRKKLYGDVHCRRKVARRRCACLQRDPWQYFVSSDEKGAEKIRRSAEREDAIWRCEITRQDCARRGAQPSRTSYHLCRLS